MAFIIRQEETRKFPVRYWRRPGGFMLSAKYASRWAAREDAELEIKQQHLRYAPCTIVEVESALSKQGEGS